MSAREFHWWQVYYSVEPFGQSISNHMTAAQSALLFNINRGEKMTPRSADDFNPFIHAYEAEKSEKESIQAGWDALEVRLTKLAEQTSD